MQNNAL